MVRFKVIRGSRLLLGVAVIALALVLCALVVRYILSGPDKPVRSTASFVTEDPEEEAEAAMAFASGSAFSGALGLDPQPQEPEVQVLPKKRVLIYHTHTHEAYQQEAEDPYEELDSWRTADPEHSVVRVGRELAELLRARGIEVVHDTTDHEQNQLSTAYTRSLETLQGYQEPFDAYIDLHRDAYTENSGPLVVTSGGTAPTARLMMLVGRGEGFSEKPFYEENYAFAVSLTQALNSLCPGICKDVLVKKNRYNQHIGPRSLLIEVGNNRNTLSEALASMPVLADALASLLSSGEEPAVQLASESSQG